ncbi:MAG: hypothetical protein WC783_00810 [Candidatus Paceibacterota bacterium]|jgi:hypothetical protein
MSEFTFNAPTPNPMAQTQSQPGTVVTPDGNIKTTYSEFIKSSVFETDWDSKLSGTGADLFKGKKGLSYRFSIVPVKILTAHVHFIPQTTSNPRGGYYLCLSARDNEGNVIKEEDCCKVYGNAIRRFGLVVVVYNTDTAGEVTQPFKFSIKGFLIRDTKFNIFKGFRKNMGDNWNNLDIKADCTEDKYQKFDFFPIVGALWKADANIAQKVIQEAEKFKNGLVHSLGRLISKEEMSAMIKGKPIEAASNVNEIIKASTSDVNVEDIMKKISGN